MPLKRVAAPGRRSVLGEPSERFLPGKTVAVVGMCKGRGSRQEQRAEIGELLRPWVSGRLVVKFVDRTPRSGSVRDTWSTWLAGVLDGLKPFGLCLVCGREAQETFHLSTTIGVRTLYLPDLHDERWDARSRERAGLLIRDGSADLELELVKSRLVARRLIPF